MLQFTFSCSNNTYAIYMMIGEFFPKSKAGNCNVLTAIYMLTGCTLCILLKSKKATEVVQTYVDNTYAKFRGSTSILSDSGTEF